MRISCKGCGKAKEIHKLKTKLMQAYWSMKRAAMFFYWEYRCGDCKAIITIVTESFT